MVYALVSFVLLLIQAKEQERNIQERRLVAVLYSFSMRLIVLPASTLRKHIGKDAKISKNDHDVFRLWLF